jgi:hypothetical protein
MKEMPSIIANETIVPQRLGKGTAGWISSHTFPLYNLSVIVLSFGDWSWALSLLQMGVRTVHCCHLNDSANPTLLHLVHSIPGFVLAPHQDYQGETWPKDHDLVCAHLSSWLQVERVIRLTVGRKLKLAITIPATTRHEILPNLRAWALSKGLETLETRRYTIVW